MALNAGSVIIPGKGTVFIGSPNAAPLVKATLDPSNPSTFTGWECLGHTSRDNAVALSKEGGDATNLGSWWDANLVSNRDAVTWGYTINSLQMDYLTLSLAFPNGRLTASGLYMVPSDGGSVDKAVYILCIDGTKRMGIYSPRGSVSLGEAPAITTDGFFETQLSGSMLSATEANGDLAIGDLIGFDAPTALVLPTPVVAAATPPSAAVGTPMTITGAYFTGATSVKFGAVSMASPVINSTGTQITGLMPAGTAGPAAVTVITPSGTSNTFAYTRGA